MPLYEYVCRACRINFEALVPASRRDDAALSCPQCGQSKAARKISLVAQPVIKTGSSGSGHSSLSSQPFDCGAPTGCCGGACGLSE